MRSATSGSVLDKADSFAQRMHDIDDRIEVLERLYGGILTASAAGGTYLPLTGGTLTGHLVGPSADFGTLEFDSVIGTGLTWLDARYVNHSDGYVSSITGTANQVVASAPTGAVTLSLPQNIHTGASPTFAALTVNGNITSSADVTAGQYLRINPWPGYGTGQALLWVDGIGGTDTAYPGHLILDGAALRVGSNMSVGGTLGVYGTSNFYSSVPFYFLSPGNGTYDKTVVYNDVSNGFYFDVARETDSPSGTPRKFAVGWRGTGAVLTVLPTAVTSTASMTVGSSSAPTRTLDVVGDFRAQAVGTFDSRIDNGPVGNVRRLATPTYWGYSSTYRVIMLGSTSTVAAAADGAVTLSFNYDPSINLDGSFQGNGNEIIFRRGTQFVTPNAANTGFNLNNLALLDGNVGIGVNSPASYLAGTSGLAIYNASYPGIAWQNGTRGWVAYVNAAVNGGEWILYDRTSSVDRMRIAVTGGSVGGLVTIRGSLNFYESTYAPGPSISSQDNGLLLVAGQTGDLRINSYNNGLEFLRIKGVNGEMGIGAAPVTGLRLIVGGDVRALTFSSYQTGGTGGGYSLYSDESFVTSYGIAMRLTSNMGTYGGVTGDWATYFNMDGSNGRRGWIWRGDSQVPAMALTTSGMLQVPELRASVFIADASFALGGRQFITKSVSRVAVAFTVPALGAAATLWVQDLPGMTNTAVFQSGDTVIVYTQSWSGGSLTLTKCIGVVTTYADQVDGMQTWTFTRGTGSAGGGATAGSVIPVDSPVLDYGVAGNGFIELAAADGAYAANAPYIRMRYWPTTIETYVTMFHAGRLDPLTGGSNEWGVVAGDWVNKATAAAFAISNARAEIYNVALKLYFGSTERIRIDPAVPSIAVGGSALPTGYLTGGNGFWVGYDSGGNVAKLRIGNPTDNRVTWDGTILNVVGAVDASTFRLFDGGIEYGKWTASGSYQILEFNHGSATDVNAGIWWSRFTGGQGQDMYIYGPKSTTAGHSPGYLFFESIPSTSQKVTLASGFLPGQTQAKIDLFGGSGAGLITSTGTWTHTGHIGTAWTGLAYATYWQDYGAGQTLGRYQKIGNRVYLQGLCKTTNATHGAVIATLPVGFRPATEHIFVCVWASAAGEGLYRMRLNTSGEIVITTAIVIAAAQVLWISLDGIWFDTTQ